MDKPTILIVDDEITIHIILKKILGEIYDLQYASNAQKAIDIIYENTVDLVMLDIQMPGLSGLELLESMMIDIVLDDIPVIIITGEATEEREKQASRFGAAGFIFKDDIIEEGGRQSIFDLIKKNINKSTIYPTSETEHSIIAKIIIKNLLNDAKEEDFLFAARRLGLNLIKYFRIDYISFWSIQKGSPNMLISLGEKQPPDFEPDKIKSEPAFETLFIEKSPYLTNNSFSDGKSIFANVEMEDRLSSEIGIPLFNITRKQLTENGMRIPDSAPLYGFVILKGNRVFTSKDYQILVKTIQYCGSILWDFFEE